MKDEKQKNAFALAVIENLGPEALASGKISVYDAFERGWDSALASIHAQQCPHGVDDGACKTCYHEATKPTQALKRLTVALIVEACKSKSFYIRSADQKLLMVELVRTIEQAIATENGMTLEE